MNQPLMPRRSLLAFLLMCCGLLEGRADWPNWRGPSGLGSVAAGVYPDRWKPGSVAWKAALPGKGGSSPAVWRDRVFVTVPAEGEDAVLAFDLSGTLVWQTKLGPASPPKHRTLGSSCNASPVTDGRAVYVYFRSGRLAALGLDGTVRWKINLTERFGSDNLFWDQGSSPVITDKDVILPRMHGGDSWVAGFDRQTGELRWKVARNFKAPTENDNGYGTPIFFEHQGKPAFLLWGADHLTAHAAGDGRLLWTCAGFNPNGTGYWPAIASPVVSGNLAIVPVGRDDRSGQARVHAIRLDGQGDVTASHRVWKREDVGVFVTTPAVYQGRVYLLRHRGEVVCLDPESGRTHWAESLPAGPSSYYASPVIGHGRLYAAREDGMVFSARVGERFELLGEQAMGERIVASPALSGGRLFLRGDKHLFCIAPAVGD